MSESKLPEEAREAMACAISERLRQGRLTIVGHVDAAVAALASAGYAVVPVVASDELLMSMAVRYDHGLAVPGHYDQPIYSGSSISHEQRLQSALVTMRQLHEEVVGTGFYANDRKEVYAAMLAASRTEKDDA